MENIGELVDRFLSWPLPDSVCSDLCVTNSSYPHRRVGTNLLTADEARQMIEYLLRGQPIIPAPNPGPIRTVAFECTAEVMMAKDKWPQFNSAHEGFAVLKEEVDELWDHVKTNQKRRDLESMRKEAIQVAAMAMRFALEVCDEINGRK